jgi:hypothetical protein
LESDGTLTYNPSTGKVTATGFVGTLTGNVTGNTSGTAATVTGAAQTNITSVGTLTALQVDNINIDGNAITSTAGVDLTITPLAGQQIVLDGAIVIDAGVVTGATSITSTDFVGDVTGDVTGNADTATTLATARTIGGVSFDGSANINLPGVNSAGNQNTSGSAATLTTARTIGGTSFDGSANIDVALATLATTATVSDSTANTNFPVVFHNESDALLDDTGALRYNPSTGTLLVPNLVVAGTTTTVDTVTMEAANAIIFEGATADIHETTLTITDPTADRTITLPDATGTVALTSSNITGSAATLTTARTIGGVSFDGSANINLPGVNSAGNQNTTGSAATLTTARTIGGVSFNGSANINLPGVNSAGNQNTTGSAATLTTARTIGGTSFDGSANIDVALATLATTVTITDNESTDENNALIFTAGGDINGGNLGLESDGTLTYNPSTGKVTATGFVGTLTGNVTGDVTGNADTATVLATARTIGGVSFDGSANINLPGVNSAGNQNTSGTAATVTGAAQTNITSVGTLTALQVDNININGNAITSTAGVDLTITPLAGQQIVLDGTIVIDAGVVTGATSITSTAFVAGDVTISTSAATTHNRISQTNSGGDAYNSDISAITTNRSWIYGAFDTAAGFTNGGWCIYDATASAYRVVIDSSGNVGIGTTTPTEKLDVVGNVTISGSIAVGSITVDNIIINGTNIGHTSDTDSIAIASNGVVTFSQIPVLPADAISSAELKTLSTLLIKDSGGTTLATFHTAGE